MEEVRVTDWESFVDKLIHLRSSSPNPSDLLFRGQADAAWSLETTLERRVGSGFKFDDYYRVANRIKPQVEVFSEASWEEIPDILGILQLGKEYDKLSRDLSFGRLPAYSYLLYLRHHRFPSPLLDWTSSPYVAAYFAFSDVSDADRAIYVYSETPYSQKGRSSNQPEIYRFGPIVKGHKRHFLQQSQYTICIQFETDQGWRFVCHDDVFKRYEEDQDILVRFVIPGAVRSRAN
jgi:FRG domain